MKQAILAVSFGTTYSWAEQTCIRPVEAALAQAFPGWLVSRAYTSRMVMRRLQERGEPISGVPEALEQLSREGFDKIVLASTHIIPGKEYAALQEAAGEWPVSQPLLAEEADLDWMARWMDDTARQAGQPMLFMGHGTDHAADETYARLGSRLSREVFLACVEGTHRLEGLLPRLDSLPEKRITLAPLMLVAGDHAHNDLAGEEEDSWKSILEARGFRVSVRMQGLGAEEAIQQRFCQKVAEAL